MQRALQGLGRRFREVSRWLAVTGFWAAVIILASDRVQAGNARPYRGPLTWSVVLCKFSDSPAPPHDVAYYRDLIANRGTSGLSDFMASISYGNSDSTRTVKS